ncbi:kinase-like domain-containing protein [Scenedesmus sp. NREL 46B-D3]|nr:kinase-like domain-containing protein [Scenedesmus sp. NREL 46B-D3]
MRRVRTLLQGLSVVTVDGSRSSVSKAAHVLLQHLQECGTDTVILTAAAPGSSVCVLAGCAGVGQGMLEQQQQLLLTDSSMAAARCNLQSPLQPYLYYSVASARAADNCPKDWQQLQQLYGLQSFLAVKIGVADDAVGVMTLASLSPSAFLEPWWEPVLTMSSSRLVTLLGHPLMAGICKIAHELHQLQPSDFKAYTTTMLQRSVTLLEQLTDRKLAVRLGLASSDESWLLLQYLPCGDEAGAHAAALAGAGAPALRQLVLPAQGTLFADAAVAKAPRMVADTKAYAEALARVNGDVFVAEQQDRALVVVPLLIGPARHKAALYVASGQPGDFTQAKQSICALASMLQLLLGQQLLQGDALERLWQGMQLPEQQESRGDEQLHSQQSEAPATASTGQLGSSSSLMQELQEKMRESLETSHAKAGMRMRYVEELHLHRVLGKGGFGTVYYGTYNGCPAAVKVMAVPKQQRQMMKGAMEMAVQATLSHPNIVRVYACLLDKVEEEIVQAPSQSDHSWAAGKRAHQPSALRFRHAEPEDVEAGLICNLMIMEFCDGDTLATAVRKGLVHETTRLEGRVVTCITMWKLLMVLLDVARSLAYIHSMSLLHCDLKPVNVLLQSCTDSPLGVVGKLADFGLVKMITNDKMYMRNKSVSGTITHLAPERFEAESQITTAVDIYAFGMIMYEAYTRQRPFKELQPAQILQAVARGTRPHFPAGAPPPYQALAEACWSQKAKQRPTADQVVRQLQDMLARTNAPDMFARRE